MIPGSTEFKYPLKGLPGSTEFKYPLKGLLKFYSLLKPLLVKFTRY